jgi:hypothetical protein
MVTFNIEWQSFIITRYLERIKNKISTLYLIKFLVLFPQMRNNNRKFIREKLMNAQSKIFIQPYEVDSQLSAIGLTTEILTEAVKRGYANKANATENDPPNAAGSMAWFATVRSLREFLISLGCWERRIIHNSSLTSNTENFISIVVYSGDKNVGVYQKITPKTKNKLGKQAESYIRKNIDNFDMVKNFGDFKGQSTETAQCQTWVLMYYHDIEKAEIRSELSLPISMDTYGRINDWEIRIILDSIPLDNTPITPNKSTDINNLPDIDIQVERKK